MFGIHPLRFRPQFLVLGTHNYRGFKMLQLRSWAHFIFKCREFHVSMVEGSIRDGGLGTSGSLAISVRRMYLLAGDAHRICADGSLAHCSRRQQQDGFAS